MPKTNGQTFYARIYDLVPHREWLTLEQIEELVNIPDTTRERGILKSALAKKISGGKIQSRIVCGHVEYLIKENGA